jgi:hypothetical protein
VKDAEDEALTAGAADCVVESFDVNEHLHSVRQTVLRERLHVSKKMFRHIVTTQNDRGKDHVLSTDKLTFHVY